MPTSTPEIRTVARSRENNANYIDLVSLEQAEENSASPEEETPRHSQTFRSFTTRKKYIAIATIATIILVAAPAYADRLTTGDNIARGVSIAGIDVGNMSQDEALEKVDAQAQAALDDELVFTLDDKTVTVSAQDIELTYDSQQSVEEAYEVSRSLNPVSVIPTFYNRTFGTYNVDIASSVDEEKFEAAVTKIVNDLSTGRANAGVEIDGTTVSVIEPQSGEGVSDSQARTALENAIATFDRDKNELQLEKVDASISLAEAQEKAQIITTMLSRESVLTTPGGNTLTIAPLTLAAAITTTPEKNELVIGIDEEIIRPALADQLQNVEVAPQDASFAVSGTNVSIVPGVVGKKIDFNSALENWIAGEHNFAVGVVDVQPERNEEWARSLNITEQVSTFTTKFPAGQERVKNIRRAAEVVNNTIIEPGQAFSLNEKLGPRTAESGYVQAPVFAEARGFFDDFGGGVSQFSTTMFNAYYLGGYRDIAHKPHTIYISRYPMGREATLNYGSVDLKFRNDSKSGILVKTSVGSTSVTVTFYGNKEGRTVETEGPNIISETPYTTEFVDDPSMPAGQEKQIQAGYPGIVVENYRTITRPGQEPKRERFRWSYKMVPRKVARGTAPAPAA